MVHGDWHLPGNHNPLLYLVEMSLDPTIWLVGVEWWVEGEGVGLHEVSQHPSARTESCEDIPPSFFTSEAVLEGFWNITQFWVNEILLIHVFTKMVLHVAQLI